MDWRVSLVDTGLATLTGGRVKRMARYLDGKPFMLTYGDGVADVDLCALLEYHRAQKKMVTVTAVHPAARFGELSIENGLVTEFREKPQVQDGWINGGFFVCEPEFIELIEGDDTVLEREPLERLASIGQLAAYRHNGFWQCMDTKRDRDLLDEMYVSGSAPWK
jgi:glucose-1-phosphate cytidylyltransferase